MKIVKVKHITKSKQTKVMDCSVAMGYHKVAHGSLPDIDLDFPSEFRPEMKAYLERRYNKNGMQRVFSAGTFTTMQIRSVIKDVARVHHLAPGTVNYNNAIIDAGSSWTDVFKLAFENKKIYNYIQKNYEVFEEILPLMQQPRSAGIHASAVIPIPETVKGQKVECFDLLPIRKMDGMLVSEISGADIDALGLLKSDILAIAELSRLSDMMKAIKKHYGVSLSLEGIINGDLNDPKVYDAIRKGLTQGVFQMSGDGITRFIKGMNPDCINDLIASVGLFRPGTLKSGAAQNYIDSKKGDRQPEYLWGTYEILKNTYGEIVWQEQVANIARKIGNLSLGDGVNLVKALSKKKIEKVRKFKEKFFEGAKVNGCPKEVADAIWDKTEKAASYLFNYSHATAYGLTGYIGAWLKVYYPIAFYTVILKWQDEDKLPQLMNEMRELGTAKIAQPDINISGADFYTDYDNSIIYWSLSRIKQLGAKAVRFIVADREKFGEYESLEQFIKRIFKYKLKVYQYWDDPDNPEENEKCPVNARIVRHLIMAGAFDRIENVQDVTERYGLLMKAAQLLGFELQEKEIPLGLRDKHYFWSQQQIRLSGMGEVDYKRIYDNCEKPSTFRSSDYYPLRELDSVYESEEERAHPIVCVTISDMSEKTYKEKRTGKTRRCGKITVRQNTDTGTLMFWGDSWDYHKDKIWGAKGRMLVAAVNIRYSDYEGKNNLNVNKTHFVKVL